MTTTPETTTHTPRTPLNVTWSVWRALFLREAVSRTTADRFAWFWMIAEPVAIISIMVAIRAFILNGRHIAGADFIPWLIIGLFGFFLVRENMLRSIGAVNAAKGLFAYRQVKPVDPVLIRCFLEGILKSLIFILFIVVGLLLEIDLMPALALEAFFFWLSLWALGTGLGLTVSSLSALFPEIGRIVRITSLPLLIISGVIFPIHYAPHQLQQYLLWNPIVHGLENLRHAFFTSYQPVSGVNATYLWYWTLSLIALGLSLHIRYEQRLKAQ